MNSPLQEVRKTLILAWPITLGMIGQHLFGLIDTIMLGHHSTVELAASSFVNNVCAPTLVFIYGYSSSISVRVSQVRGQGEEHKISALLKNGLLSQLALSLISFVILLAFSFRLEIFGQSPEVTAASGRYLLYMAASQIPLSLFMAMRQFSDGLERTKVPTVIISMGFIVNTLLNALLIFGHWGFPELGIEGAGIATFAARLLMFLAFAAWLQLDKGYRLRLFDFWQVRLSLQTIKDLFRIGGPSSIQYLFEVGLFAGSAILMGWFGTETLAAHQVVINLATVTFMLPMSLSIATSVRVGHATGRLAWNEVSLITWSSVVVAIGLMSVCGLFFFLGRSWIPTWFTSDEKVILFASQIFILAAIFQIFDGVQSVLVGALRGANDVKAPTAITFIAYWVVGSGAAYWLGFILDFKHIGIWSGLALSLIVSSLALSSRFHTVMRARRSQ
jgi:MATE family multidrug resistance protein